ncbi:MAG: hypothetical protein OEZ58_01155 [Gammaproteobacteria bacterium]|nr:hypothetical protein [Gammaproteobacteria bacterium]MDH5727584.1 hypothetical protein [Gammaproteobacteria bacterium]
MILSLTFDDKSFDVDVPDALIKDAEDFYQKMDADMDKGWQLSREWVSHPTIEQRCQVVADKILDAFNDQKEDMIILFSGYILSRIPECKKVVIDTSGDISQSQLFVDA